MAQIAKVYIIDVPYHVDIAYSYFIPGHLEDSVLSGMVVEVPFGKGNRKMTGIVVDITDEECTEKTKPVASVIGDGPILTGELIGLCRFIKDYTLCTFGDAVRAVIPSAALSKVITYYRIIPENERVSDVGLNAALDAIGERGRLVYRTAEKKQKFSRQYLQTELEFDCTGIIMQMLRYNLCEKCTEIKNSSAPKTRRILSLSQKLISEMTYDPTYYDEVLLRLRGNNQKKILEGIRSAERVVDTALYDDLGIRHTAGKNAVDSLANYGLVVITIEEEYRNHFTADSFGELSADAGPIVKPTLSEEQTRARDTIVSLYESHKPCAALLHGVTGSGKTNVIMASIDRVLEDGRGVIMLIPEIALTPQTVGIFLKRYGGNIAVIHSGLSGGERYDAWRRIKTGQANVVIGTRSAIFAPLHDIGMIIIDEEHEYTYKSDTNPKYHAHDIARYRCRDHNAVMLLSSATPSVSSYYKAKSGAYTLVELKERYGNAVLPTVQIYDMRGETQRGNLSPVGSLLADRLHSDKEAGNQSILFLNRRGYNNYVSCRKCGKSIKCPNCSVTLTYHAKKGHFLSTDPHDDPEAYENVRREGGYLTCHTCGYRSSVPDKCPECGGEHFLFVGCGTQKAEDDIAALFPDLRILRMDFDTTQAKYSHEEILSKFRAGDADVLLGTQMVTKGHDFPRVATVGVLNADSALSVDDYRAGERTFAMLTQVIGRAGRGDIPGTAIIQTYNPSNEVLLMAARQDYIGFYEGEIRLRKALCFPPFCDIAVITLSSRDEGYLGIVTKRMYERIIEYTRAEFHDLPLMVYGPFEAPVYRVQNMCRMRFVLKCRINKRTREFLSSLMCEFAKSSPSEYKRTMISAQTDRRLTVSVDLNPSTV